jgi:ABC-type uncharacterized transport system permease subunit
MIQDICNNWRFLIVTFFIIPIIIKILNVKKNRDKTYTLFIYIKLWRINYDHSNWTRRRSWMVRPS